MTQGLNAFCITSPRIAQHREVASGKYSKTTWANLPHCCLPNGLLLPSPLSGPELWICKELNMSPGSRFQVPKDEQACCLFSFSGSSVVDT